jgi:predicted nucleic acid-binding protein
MVVDVIIDTSVAAAMMFEDEQSPLAEALEPVMLAGGRLIAPQLIVWECTNALRSAVLSKRITAAKAETLLARFCSLPLKLIDPPAFNELPSLLKLAVKHQLTSYDAAYLQLAIEHHSMLRPNGKG